MPAPGCAQQLRDPARTGALAARPRRAPRRAAAARPAARLGRGGSFGETGLRNMGGLVSMPGTGGRMNEPAPVVNHDPEGLFKGSAPQAGLIEQKMMRKRVEADAQSKEATASSIRAAREELAAKRDERVVPDDERDLVEFFLSTEAADVEWEVARCKPRLTKDFFAVLDTLVGTERFSPAPDEERLAELELLRTYLLEAGEAVERAAVQTAAPAERLKKLLAAPDKKACLLEMAAANEIDAGFFALLDQNIEGARAAGEAEAAEFMTKVKQAAARYSVTV
jgi:hypothetical protein